MFARLVPSLALLAPLSMAAPARAESVDWLDLDGGCAASSAELGPRVEAALASPRPPEARARVRLEEVEGGVRLAVALTLAEHELGTKTVVLPSCEEALDAAVLVLAVALDDSSPRASGTPERSNAGVAPERSSTDVSPREAAPERERAQPAAFAFSTPRAVTADANPALTDGSPSAGPSVRVGVLGGVDAGTLSHATPYVGAAITLVTLPIDVRAAFRYGLRREEEEVESGRSLQSSADFGAIELAACRETRSSWELGLCAGGEFGLVRVEQLRSEPDRSANLEETSARVAGVLAGRVARRVGAVRLELELAGSAVALRPDASSRTSVRVGAGAGTQF
jgi:hypothetical protein